MCEFPSWIEEDSGKAIFLIDADVVALMEVHGGGNGSVMPREFPT